MKQLIRTALTISKQTVRNLATRELTNVQGGLPDLSKIVTRCPTRLSHCGGG